MTDTTSAIQTVDEHGARVQQMFGEIAHGYDRANTVMSLGQDVRWRQSAVDQLLPPDSPSRPRVLDLCAGTLESSLEIHRRHPSADIVAGDFSPGMLETGRKRVARYAPGAPITAVQMDAHTLPVGDEELDAIFCAFGIRNLSDLERATREQARCLRPGGRLTVLEFFQPARWPAQVIQGLYNRTVLPVVGLACTGKLGAYLYLPRSIGRFCQLDDYCALLRRCGFESVTATPLTLGVASIVQATKTSRGSSFA